MVGTPFHTRAAERNEKLAWEDWSGFHAASVFHDFHDIEYNAVREAVGVIDVSPLYKYLVRGADAMRLVDRIITRDATRQEVDQVFYTPWCDERGKVFDDGTITRLGESTYRWTAAEPQLRWFDLNSVGLDVEIEDVTEEVAALAVQGPRSRALLEDLTGRDWSDVRYYRRRLTEIRDLEVDVTRTGYTGDLGYELWVRADRAGDLWDALFEAGERHGIRPVGMRALDVLRVEAGLILIDADYIGVRSAWNADQEYSPFELGMDRLVNLKKPHFNGKRALQAEQDAGGPRRRLVGIEYDWAAIERAFERHGLPPVLSPQTSTEQVPVYRGNRRVGKVTSATWSPILKRLIALASVGKEHAEVGTKLAAEFTIEARHHRVAATVVPLPFLDLPRKRA
ncbi:MAG TPA: aminomethyltransferase family protein [Actinomycetota bacterium]|nr:aminomethyltransferase family protein [Actinomycetota bacterium]